MQQVTNQQKLKPWMGFVLFAVVMVLFLFAGARMQTAWRIYGLIATEAMFLVIAILYAVIFRIPLKEMFPVKKFKVRDFFGSLFLAGGGVLIGFVSIAIVGILIPSSLGAGDVQAISEFNSGSSGYLLTIFAMAVTPAICEEAIQRGAIIANFRTIKKDWIIVLIMGLFFGIFHMSVLRFINTAIMGACLSYIVVKKNNMVLSSLMHFLINFVATSLSYVASVNSGNSAAAALTADTMKVALGTYLLMGFAAPFFIVIGLMLLNPESHKKIRFLFAAIASVIMLIGGFAVTISNR
ncbi:MAG: CPBP family intramembrane metalloprotease, partial [Clostridiales bacterium]|nr:CPBP family intramembrane metalloprotease [Clostridiales bacterium]